jgi:hypothetical protein
MGDVEVKAVKAEVEAARAEVKVALNSAPKILKEIHSLIE